MYLYIVIAIHYSTFMLLWNEADMKGTKQGISGLIFIYIFFNFQ